MLGSKLKVLSCRYLRSDQPAYRLKNPVTLDLFAQVGLETHLQEQVKATIVMDAGLATKDNLNWLKTQGYSYLVVDRGKTPFEIDDADMRLIREDEQKGIKIEVKRREAQEEMYLLVKSERKRLKEKYSRAAQLYEITVVPQADDGKNTVNAVDIRWTRKEPRYDPAVQGEGTYVLRTNRSDLTDEQTSADEAKNR